MSYGSIKDIFVNLFAFFLSVNSIPTVIITGMQNLEWRRVVGVNPLHYHCSRTPPRYLRCAFPLIVTDESPTDIPHHNNIHSVIRELSGGILWRNHPEIIMKNSIFSIRLEHQYSPSPGKLYKVNIKKSQMKSMFLIGTTN